MKGTGRLVVIAIGSAFLLCGCSGSDPGKAREGEAASPQNRELLNAVRQPLDRAREVEDVSAARKGELDKEIEASE